MCPQSTRIMRGLALTALVSFAGCSSGGTDSATKETAGAAQTASAAKVDPCTVVTPEEVEAAVGWKVQKTSPIPAGCSFTGPNELQDIASVVVSSGMQAMSSSEEMAAWRKGQTKSSAYADIKFIIEPISDLGVPAIRNQLEGVGGIVGVESYVRGRLLTVSTATLEASKALTRSALARIP